MKSYERDSAGRNVYPAHIKTDVLTLLAAGAQVTQLAAEYSLSPQIIHKWRASARQTKTLAEESPELSASAKDALIVSLQAELRRSQQREDILKKALAILNPIV